MILYIAEQIRLIGGKYAEEIFFRRAFQHSHPRIPCQDMSRTIERYHQGYVDEITRTYVHFLHTKERQDE